MSKKYKLLKDLPGADAGTIFEIKADNLRVYINNDLGYVYHVGEKDKTLPAISTEHLNSDWFEEVKEIPKDQAWVVPGKKYVWLLDDNWFMPEVYSWLNSSWHGVNSYGKPESWPMTSTSWTEYVEPQKPKRRAPAYIFKTWNPEVFWLSHDLFNSDIEARRTIFMGETRPDIAFEWPALPDSEGYYPGPKGGG